MSRRTASIDLPPASTSVPASRHLVLELLRVWDVPHDREDAALLVTELVANVVDHVGGEADLTLELSLSGSRLRIAVADGSAIRPVVQELSRDRPRGRGLRMVESIADGWGAEDHRGGKRVWLDLRPPPPDAVGRTRGLPLPRTGEGSGDDITERERTAR
jgi:anti-sigma regulatory factor (Ser/Thr protein kinase)